MTLKFGPSAPVKLYYGEHLIQHIYAGSELVWGGFDNPGFVSLSPGVFTLAGQDLQTQKSGIVTLNHGEFDLVGFDVTGTHNSGEPTDPYWGNVVLLMSFDGVDGSRLMVDDSSWHHEFINAVGNAAIDTAQSVFGGSSVVFDGFSDRVEVPHLAELPWQLGATNSDPWTVETRVRWNTLTSANRGIIGQDGGGSNRGWTLTGSTTIGELGLAISTGGSSFDVTLNSVGAGMTTGVWYHVAADKDATGKIRLYVDGVMVASDTPVNSGIFASTAKLSIGAQSETGAVDMDGWLDELRITKGVARYASDAGFTVPDAPFARSGPPPYVGRLTQMYVETLMSRPGSFTMTQMYDEVLLEIPGSLTMTQCYVEVLMEV